MTSPVEKLKEAREKAEKCRTALLLADTNLTAKRHRLRLLEEAEKEAKNLYDEWDDEETGDDFEEARHKARVASWALNDAKTEWTKANDEKKKADEAVNEAEALVRNSGGVNGANGANSTKGGKRSKRRTMRRKRMRSAKSRN